MNKEEYKKLISLLSVEGIPENMKREIRKITDKYKPGITFDEVIKNDYKELLNFYERNKSNIDLSSL